MRPNLYFLSLQTFFYLQTKIYRTKVLILQIMQFTPQTTPENTPFTQLLKLGLFAVIGLILVTIATILVMIFTNGPSIFGNPKALAGLQMSMPVLKIILVIQQILVFLLPAALLAYTEKIRLARFYALRAPKVNLLLIVLLLMICAVPILGLSAEWNQNMTFPKSLSWLEKWMVELEKQGEVTTKAILKMDGLGSLLINLFVIALMPALCEEFLFRAALQRTLLRMIANPHVAIWLSAIIFSTIHFQFFGFLPRMLLGAAFGYIYFWTKSLWYTVFAHFLNNGYAVAVAYYLQQKNLPMEQANDASFAWYGYLISAILTLALCRLLSTAASKEPTDQ
jgi:membrane protease YdiL (CAAX protease family)